MRSILRKAEIVAFAWWLFAISATVLFTIHLPYVPKPSYSSGCVLSSDWFDYVECGPTLLGSVLGGLLTWTMLWTKDVQVLLELAMIPPFIPVMFLWAASALLAISHLVRILLRVKQRYGTH